MLAWIVYIFFRLVIGLVRILPFAILYKIADVVAFILHKVIFYRKKVIYTNLKNSFPTKTKKELQAIQKAFYLHLADLLVETLKGYSLPPEQLMLRYRFKDLEKLKAYKANGQSVVFVGGHFGNWEWGVMCGAMQLPHYIVCYYQPIKNRFINEFYRQKFSKDRNLITIPKKKAVRTFVEYRKETVGHLLIADQNPVTRNNSIWLDFLSQDTICITGPEKLAQKFDYPTFFVKIEKVKRGYYETELIEITPNSKATDEGEITKKFMRLLEQQINANPPYWLWSHKRWKKKRKKGEASGNYSH